MIDPLSPKGNCPHCKSSKMEYCGFTYMFHFYFKCLECNRYIEYRTSLKYYAIVTCVMMAMAVFAFSFPFSLFPDDSHLSVLSFFIIILLFTIVGYKYRWYGVETIALEKLPSDRWIIPALPTKIRLPILYILVAALIAYTGICIYNLTRQ